MLEYWLGGPISQGRIFLPFNFYPFSNLRQSRAYLLVEIFWLPVSDWPDFHWHLGSSTSVLGAGIKHHHPRPQLAGYWNCCTRVCFWPQLQILNWELFYSHFYVWWQEKVLPLHQPALERSLGTPLSPALGLILVFIIICVCQIPLSLWD